MEAGAKRLAQVILGASHLAQSAIPPLLCRSNPKLGLWKETLRQTLERQANFLCRKLEACQGLRGAVQPQGAMYAMVEIDTDILNIGDDLEFSGKLLEEENVFVLPGSAFGFPNMFRVVFCSAEPLLEEAGDRIARFCNNRRSKK